jgi:uncharacterized protein YbjT (DUF2867 family)
MHLYIFINKQAARLLCLRCMKILLTGANGYIGRRLLPVLVNQGHEVYAVVRDKRTFHLSDKELERTKVVEADFLKPDTFSALPTAIDVAFYLMHSLASESKEFASMEKEMAENFVSYLEKSQAKQQIFLGGISNDQDLSEHLNSRLQTEKELAKSKVPLTVFRAAIIIGSGGASFEIIRDLVEKLPFMIAPKWLNTKCQPIAIRNVIDYLSSAIGNESTYGEVYDIGGPEVLTYKQMLMQFAEVRKMKRYILTVPVMSPRISSYWLYFVTATSYRIAVNLVDSMRNEVVVKKRGIEKHIPIDLLNYKEAVGLAFNRIEQNMVISSWTDTQLPENKSKTLSHYIQVPQNGVFKDTQRFKFPMNKAAQVEKNVWAIGGERGWYYGNLLWKIRGQFDKFVGGVGLRRGRRNPQLIYAGDSLDFWRVLLADPNEKRLLLFAEMKLPGEAWLEFKIEKLNEQESCLCQTATFRPKGLWGRIYWYTMLPFHWFIFKNMAKNIVEYKST